MGFSFIDFFYHSTFLTIAVLGILSLYFIAVNWVFIYRYYFVVAPQVKEELDSLESMLMGGTEIPPGSFSYNFVDKFSDDDSKRTIHFSRLIAMKEMTKGLTFLSIASTTSPFIGLFGTVFSILNTFTLLGNGEKITSIAAGIGEALFVTSIGIFVAIFAYTYHQILKRKIYELLQVLKIESEGMVFK